MASDEIVWNIINNQHCSFKLKTTKDQNFCRNEFNVTGFCSRQACPLANSRYATIRSDPATGRMYLYIKTIERSHLPKKWWERIRLPSNYAKALESIDEQLIYWPKFLVHKCKQRLTRLTQVAIRTRKLVREQERLGEHLVPKLAPKIRRREATRERKAEAAAKVERTIERELIERLRSGAYGDKPINVEEGIWKKVLRGLEKSGEGKLEVDPDMEEEWEEEDELEEGMGQVEFVSDVDSDSEDEDLDDLEDWIGSNESGEEDVNDSDDAEDDDDDEEGDAETDKLKRAIQNLKRKRVAPKAAKPKKKAAKGARREIEYEREQPQRVLETA
ncbi:Mak16 protein [Microthyrium microscopicum]|uniref:Protein MAK16 n=1 Tax=Microthyrium microscopicum TaxID=703497 RepID=A0A6A6TXP4_9PEZI|nr:Mak16 protein [Microthyrium microscopicum]